MCGLFKFLIIVAYTISINILSIVFVEGEKSRLYFWSNKIDGELFDMRSEKRIPHDLMCKNGNAYIRKHTPTYTSKTVECNSDDNGRRLTIDWPICTIAITLRNHIIRSID